MAKNKLEINNDSITILLQEAYNETIDQRNKALGLLNKYLKNVEENSDIAMVGKINNELLKVIDSSIGKKIELAKLMADIMNKQGNIKVENDATQSISKEQKSEMRKLIKEIKEGKVNITNG
jgi:hypothetical protein